jgi:hypothetical protein
MIPVDAAQDEDSIETFPAKGADDPFADSVPRGARTGVLTIRMPFDLMTSSKEGVNLESRSRIKKLIGGLRSAHPKLTLRACWVTHPATGLLVMPARWTTRECRSMKIST